MDSTARPSAAVIEFNSICNTRCIFCPVGHGLIARPRVYMQTHVFDRIADQIRAFVRYMYIGGYGEFTLHPKFKEWVPRLKEFTKLNLATNATFLNDDVLEALTLIDDLSV